MWATAGGAVIGAVFAWGFALDLRRRERQDRVKTDLNSAVADVIESLADYNAAARARLSREADVNVHAARARALSAARVAQTRTARDARAPFIAVHALIRDTGMGDGSDARAAALTHAGDVLLGWHNGAYSAHQAELKIRGEFAGVPG